MPLFYLNGISQETRAVHLLFVSRFNYTSLCINHAIHTQGKNLQYQGSDVFYLPVHLQLLALSSVFKMPFALLADMLQPSLPISQL